MASIPEVSIPIVLTSLSSSSNHEKGHSNLPVITYVVDLFQEYTAGHLFHRYRDHYNGDM